MWSLDLVVHNVNNISQSSDNVIMINNLMSYKIRW